MFSYLSKPETCKLSQLLPLSSTYIMITKFCCFPSKILSSLSLFLHATAIARPVILWLNLYNILPDDVPDSYIVSFSFSTFSKTQMWLCLGQSVMSNSLQPHRPIRLFSPWKLSRQEYWVGCHVLLQGVFPTQGLNPDLPHCKQIL